MVKCCKHHIMAYLATVTKCHSAMILKMAAGIDKHTSTHMYVPAEIRVEWRKDTQSVGHLISEKFRQHGTDFIRCMIGRVQLKRDTSCLVAHVVHQPVDFRGVKSLSGLDEC